MEGHLPVVDLLLSSGADTQTEDKVCATCGAIGNDTESTMVDDACCDVVCCMYPV